MFQNTPSATRAAFTPVNQIRFDIMLKQELFLAEYHEYSCRMMATKNAPTYRLHAALKILFLKIDKMLARSMEEIEYNSLRSQMQKTSLSITEIMDCYDKMDFWLDAKGITKIDTKDNYDETDPEAENEASGL